MVHTSNTRQRGAGTNQSITFVLFPSHVSSCLIVREILMADEQVIKLLEEIRDLQKQQIENSKQALAGQQISLANQQRSLETQKQAMQRSRVALILIGVLFAAIFLIPTILWGVSWSLRCLLPR